MKITKYSTIIAMALFVLGATNACNQNTDTKNTASNQPAANTSANTNKPAENKPEANKTEANKTETDKSTVGSLATPTDTYKAANAARKNKDIEGLKKVFSKELLGFLTDMAKAEGKTLDENLKKMVEEPSSSNDEVRNEKIDGDRATLEYRDDSGAWMPMDFVKEGSDWKMTIPKEDKKKTDDKKSDDKKTDDKKQQQ